MRRYLHLRSTNRNKSITDELTKPFECGNDVCGSKNLSKLVPEESTWIDEQKLELGELDKQTRNITVLVKGRELIDTIPDIETHAIITGTLRVIENGSSLLDNVLEVNRIEIKEIKKISLHGISIARFQNLRKF